MIDFSLTREQESLRKEIIRFAKKELNDDVLTRDAEKIFRRDLWEKCADMGLAGLPAATEFGGGGFDALNTAIMAEAFGYGCADGGLVFSMLAHTLTCVEPIQKYGTDEQKKRFLPSLCDGTHIGGNAMTEPDSGSDAFALRTRAVPDDSGFRLTGTKTFCTNAPVADVLLIYAKTEPVGELQGDITAFLVECESDGITIGKPLDKSGLRTSTMAEVALDNLYVPADNIVGGVGGGSVVFSQSMDWERSCLFAAHVGVIERLLERAVKYAKSRKQNGQTIGKFQSVSNRIADLKIQLEASRLLAYNAAWRIDNRKNGTLASSIAKTFISESVLNAAMDTLKTLGGYGFMTDYEVERVVRDSLAAPIYSGTNDVQRQIISRFLGL